MTTRQDQVEPFKIVRRFVRRDRGAYSGHIWLAYGARISARGTTVVLASQAVERKTAKHIAQAQAAKTAHDSRLCGQCAEEEETR